MARKPDVSPYKTFDQIADRLEEIVGKVRDKDISLEHSLDLFDEAVVLGAKAVELVDTTDFSPAELERMKEPPAADEQQESAGADAQQSAGTDAGSKEA